jgi:hypothetical protein
MEGYGGQPAPNRRRLFLQPRRDDSAERLACRRPRHAVHGEPLSGTQRPRGSSIPGEGFGCADALAVRSPDACVPSPPRITVFAAKASAPSTSAIAIGARARVGRSDTAWPSRARSRLNVRGGGRRAARRGGSTSTCGSSGSSHSIGSAVRSKKSRPPVRCTCHHLKSAGRTIQMGRAPLSGRPWVEQRVRPRKDAFRASPGRCARCRRASK